MQLLLNDPKYRDIIVTKLGAMIQKQLRVLGSRRTKSLLHDKSKAGFLSFSWEAMWRELAIHTPTFLGLLEAVLSCKTAAFTRTQPVICMVVAIIAKYMNPTMNVVQSYISILLHAGHCSKQVMFSHIIIWTTLIMFMLLFQGVLSTSKAYDMHVSWLLPKAN